MRETDAPAGGVSRRTALRTAAGVAGGAALAAGAGTASAQDGVDFEGWFDNTGNFDGVVDRTGQDEVTVMVGADGNNGPLAFGPAAIRVDPGTTVTWEWTGEGGPHNVVADDGSYRSGDAVPDAGTTFSHTFESPGVSKYYCSPHETLGMKGAVVVGSPGSAGGTGGTPDYGGWFSDTGNFDGETFDARGRDEVTVAVGADGNNGPLAFDPPAVHVDPGATVVWEWTGEGGTHNVVAEDGTFDSGEAVAEAGTTFEYTFESDGMYRYVCEPHETLGMVGAVVVGDEYPSTGGGGGITRPANAQTWLTVFAGLLTGLFVLPFGFALYLRRRYPDGVPSRPELVSRDSPTAVETADDEPLEELDHDEFDPKGTLSLVLVYLAILVIMWVFMYFVEFLGGPTVIG